MSSDVRKCLKGSMQRRFTIISSPHTVHLHSTRHHCRTQHHGTADAAHRHARAGGREQNGQCAIESHAHTHSNKQHHRVAHAAQPSSSRHHAETRHPGTADAAHRHARAGLRERNGPKLTRGARAHRPATSQHRVGRRRRSSP